MQTYELIEKARGRSYASSGTGRAVRVAGGHSQTDVAAAMTSELHRMGQEDALVLPSTVSRYDAGLRVPQGLYAIAYCRVIDALLAGEVKAS